MTSPELRYRPDIDGLRALAVASVIVFHMHERWLPGGFVGVDVFFVISGFLISSLIDREMVQGRFGFGSFYRRRILRIAPAYFVVTIATLLAGVLLMVPEDLLALSKSALWSAVSLPNMYFWRFLDTGYFAADSRQLPLLHLWSLGVEEQFYVIWPALLLGLRKIVGHRMLLVPLVAMAIVSFVLSQKWAISDFTFAYYMLPARAGELLVGAVAGLALARAGNKRLPRLLSELFAAIGFGLIGYAVWRIDRESTFPGYNALFPCIGAALVIVASHGRVATLAKVLTWRPIVFIGLISYSLYLWHWPILAFARYFLTELSPLDTFTCLGATVLISIASFRYVELPFRSARFRAPALAARTVATYATAVIAIAAVSGAFIRFDGLQRLPLNDAYNKARSSMRERTEPALAYQYNCQSSNFYPSLFRDPKCVVGNPGALGHRPPRVILIGDSNAAHYIGVLGAIAREYGFAFRNVSLSSCPPLFGSSGNYGNPKKPEACRKYRAAIRKQVEPYDYVVLGAQWTAHGRHKAFRRDLQATIRDLRRRGKQVVIMGMVPRFPAYGTKCELRRLKLHAVDCEARSLENGFLDVEMNRYLEGLANADAGISYLDAGRILCNNGRCSPYLDGKPVYYNPGHLSMVGSWEIGRKMVSRPDMIPDMLKQIGNGR